MNDSLVDICRGTKLMVNWSLKHTSPSESSEGSTGPLDEGSILSKVRA